MYKCESCCYKTNKYFNFLKHKNRKKPCYTHNYVFDVAKNVQNVDNNDVENEVDDTLISTECECNQCGKLFVSDRNLKRHLRVCKGGYYMCLVCKKTFGTRYGLYQHRKNVTCSIKPMENNTTNNHIDNSTINVTNNNVTNVERKHMKLNFFGNENLKYLKSDSSFIDTTNKCIEKGVYGMIDLVGKIFMNPYHPENHTMSKFREKGKDLFVKNEENGWEFRHYDDVKGDIVNALSNYMKIYNEQTNSLRIKRDGTERNRIRTFFIILLTIGGLIDIDLCDEMNIDESDIENEELVNQKFDVGTLLRMFQCSKAMYRKNGEKITYKNRCMV